MTAPRIYKAINAVMAELAQDGIAKTHTSPKEQYLYRSIDDVLNRLAPLLAKYRLCVLPRVLERVAVDRSGVGDEILVGVTLKVVFDLVSALDQSRHTVQAFGEALDAGDKGTSKAMSAAYKAAMLQTFCIPVDRADEADAHTHKLLKGTHEPQPVQGWEHWCHGVIEIIGSCDSEDALGRVQDSQRSLLKALGRERSDLYTKIGEAFASRTLAVRSNPSDPAFKRSGHDGNGDVSSTKAQSLSTEAFPA